MIVAVYDPRTPGHFKGYISKKFSNHSNCKNLGFVLPQMMLQRLLEILLWVGELTTGKIKVLKNLSREDSVYYNHHCDSSY